GSGGHLPIFLAALFLAAVPLPVCPDDPGPCGRKPLSVLAIGGDNFAPGRHGYAETLLPTIDTGRFVSRRLEVGLDIHPWIGIRQPVHENGDGGDDSVTAVAIEVYGGWYPAQFTCVWSP